MVKSKDLTSLRNLLKTKFQLAFDFSQYIAYDLQGKEINLPYALA